MPETKQIKLYDGEVDIIFYPKSHRYKLKDQKGFITSVSSVLRVLSKSDALIYWAVNQGRDYLLDLLKKGEPINEGAIIEASRQHRKKKDEAADIGTQVHDWVNRYIQGENPRIPENKKVKNGVIAFLDWTKREKVEFIESEQVVYSKQFNYVGTFDSTAHINNEYAIIDVKTSKDIYAEMLIQLAAYYWAYGEEKEMGKLGINPITKGIIAHFDKETGNFKTVELSIDALLLCFNIFKNALEIKNSEKKLQELLNGGTIL